MFSVARPHRHDVLLAVIGLSGGVFLWLVGIHIQNGRLFDAPWVSLLPLAAMSALELLRRSVPCTALAVGTLALVADQFTVGSLATLLMYTDLVYAAVLYGSPTASRRIPVITLLVTVAATMGFVAWAPSADALLIGIVTGMVLFGPALTGASVRNHRDAADAARLRADQTALLAEMDRVQAVTAERSRMARELHDMVANHLSAIAIHSTAALSIDEPGTSREALGVIRQNSVDGLTEMRRLIGLLRDSGASGPPSAAPTLGSLDALVEQAGANSASSGLTVILVDGREVSGPLPAPVELAAYRIVQESLTNALKHAAPGPVTVRLERSRTALTVEVSSVFGDRPGPRAPGSGAGLVGMRERVALLGGTIGAGPGPRGDGARIWLVRAELPVEERT
ncbi:MULTISPECIES: sensor histidine kinase [Streptomyces]|uniref:histidine kinase n=1 Tax=Streptomyces glycanivorans TaxID=3033808 RepID=A0ABY9J8M7_9ACTN|nr:MULTISPECIES: histidine kinase [unclassified Streptomyces]TXS18091.1 two-component sensor histidine kinase [Streptomyces sp. wa22]WLQ64145.1 histidine kinase [Streptomyces sp. Alt3]WSQ84897.1 histidine kinase [Streptomyces sp. NBC_01212]WSR09020.1 histidine kinase [Streptomyces sp. NBC_01208]WSR48251.1 histidine kinase [Streptomyces sp. NBC_01201]